MTSASAAPRFAWPRSRWFASSTPRPPDRLREAETAQPGWIVTAPDIQSLYGEPAEFAGHLARLESHLQVHPDDRDAWLVLGAEWYLSGRTARAADVFLRLNDPDASPTSRWPPSSRPPISVSRSEPALRVSPPVDAAGQRPKCMIRGAMTEIARYYAAACQTDLPCPRRPRRDPRRGSSYLLGMVDRAVVGYEPFFDVKLVVFPEFAHAAPIYETVDELLDRLAVPIPNEHTDRYAEKARERGVYIQTGTFLEVDDRWPGVVFNTTCLIGPDGLLSRYRKVNPVASLGGARQPARPAGLRRAAFPVVETEIGRLGAAICYDWLFPEAIRALALAGAEVLIRVSAYMDPWGATPPLDWWTLFNRARAVENFAFVVAANQGASAANYPPFSWPGGSMIVDYDGRILCPGRPRPGREDRRRPDRPGRPAGRAAAPARPSSPFPPPDRGLY